MLWNNEEYLKNFNKHLKNSKKHFKKLQKYQCGLDFYLINTMKKTIPLIMILMYLKRLESFLMNVEVIFYIKKQRELEKNSIE